jgi:hypothetical protein
MPILWLPLKKFGAHSFVETEIEHDVRFKEVLSGSGEVVEVETR